MRRLCALQTSPWTSDLPASLKTYTKSRLPKTMNSSGRYVLQYQPSNEIDNCNYLQVGIQMTISDEATINDMIDLFDAFLKASGYVYNGQLKIVEEDKFESQSYIPQDFWDDDGTSLVGNPWVATAGSRLRGGSSEDHLSFHTSFGNNVVTFE